MKRYHFAPGAVQCYRTRRSPLARLQRAVQALKRLAQAGEPVDSIGQFVLLAAIVAAASACIGMVAGCVDFALAAGGF